MNKKKDKLDEILELINYLVKNKPNLTMNIEKLDTLVEQYIKEKGDSISS